MRAQTRTPKPVFHFSALLLCYETCHEDVFDDTVSFIRSLRCPFDRRAFFKRGFRERHACLRWVRAVLPSCYMRYGTFTLVRFGRLGLLKPKLNWKPLKPDARKAEMASSLFVGAD